MKLLKTIFILFSLLFFVFLGFLFSLESETNLSEELNTEIPVPAAFKQLILTTTHKPYLLPQTLDSVQVSFVYFKDKKKLSVLYRPAADFDHYRLQFLPVDSATDIQPFKRITHTISLHKLVDGSTSIHWQVHYRIPGLTPRLLNYFVWKPQIQKFLNNKMNELKAFFH